jgi:hypothetical protein
MKHMEKTDRYDMERIGTICSDIQRYLRDLKDLNIRQIEDMNDKRNFYAVSMILFSIFNRVFDLGSEVALPKIWGYPQPTVKYLFCSRKTDVLNNLLQKI